MLLYTMVPKHHGIRLPSDLHKLCNATFLCIKFHLVRTHKKLGVLIQVYLFMTFLLIFFLD
jgi:hypothetical protein